MDTSTPAAPASPLTGKASFIVGTIGGLLASATPFVPPPFGPLAGIVGFLLCVLAGIHTAPPKLTDGKPLLQGAALTSATVVISMLVEFYDMIPHGWPQSIALGVVAFGSWLTGRALPPLGAKAKLEAAQAVGAAAAAQVDTKTEAIAELRGPQP